MTRRAAIWLLGMVVVGGAAALVWMPHIAAVQWAREHGAPTIGPARQLAPGVNKADDWFVVAQIAPGTFAIGEPRYGQCNFAYLFVGGQRALLWDAGPGVRDMAPIVARLTPLPVTVMPSHLHFDHVGGLARFADVALPDLPELRARATPDGLPLRRFEHLGFVEGFAAPTIRVTRWIAPGSVIDLGGRTLSIATTPGHTDNSIVLTDLGSGDTYTGDTLYPGNVYAFLPGTDLAAYRRSVAALLASLRPGAKLHGGHGCATDGPVAVPTQTRPQLEALRDALGAAAQFALDPTMPRVIPTKAGITILAKHAWMAKGPA